MTPRVPIPRSKHDAWRDSQVAGAYDARRFQGGLKGVKNRHDGVLLERILDGQPGARSVLDLPTGTGRLLGSLGASGRSVMGADRSLEMLQAQPGPDQALSNKPLNSPLVQADVRALPFRDDAFDVVVCMRFLFHLKHSKERVEALAEMARVAGQLVVVQVRHRANAKQAGRWLRSRAGLSKRWRPAPSRAGLEAELHAAGLELLRAIPVSRLLSDKLLLVANPRT